MITKLSKQTLYNVKREQDDFERKLKLATEYENELLKMYQRNIREIEKNIDAWVGRYAEAEGISPVEAFKMASKHDVQAFSEKAREYVKMKNFSDRANEELRLYNLSMRINRAELLKRQMTLEIIALANEEEAMLLEHRDKMLVDELNRQSGILSMSNKDRESVKRSAERALLGDYHSATFSDRIWANAKSLQYELSRGIDRSILQGQNPKRWAKDLKGYVRHEAITKRQSATFMANRIAITETARVQSEVAKASFKEMGFEKYIWVAEPDACPICLPLHEHVFDVKEATIGDNMPPKHPFCRCSIAAYME